MSAGPTAIVGAFFAKLLQGRLGPNGYTHRVNATPFCYLCMKARARGFRGMATFPAIYSIWPYLIRSSAVNFVFYDRGLVLGLLRRRRIAGAAAPSPS